MTAANFAAPAEDRYFEDYLPGAGGPAFDVPGLAGRGVPVADVAARADDRDGDHPAPGQVEQDLVGVPGPQSGTLLDRGEHAGADHVPARVAGGEGVDGLEDGQVDGAQAAALGRGKKARRNDAIRVDVFIDENRAIHERQCINLNPGTNAMNPKAEAALAAGLGSRPSLGYPGDKYEMGLEAIERIEVIAAELAAEIFGARHAEIRVPSGSIANLYAFMATTRPGDRIIAPPPAIGGHITHHDAGAAGPSPERRNRSPATFEISRRSACTN